MRRERFSDLGRLQRRRRDAKGSRESGLGRRAARGCVADGAGVSREIFVWHAGVIGAREFARSRFSSASVSGIAPLTASSRRVPAVESARPFQESRQRYASASSAGQSAVKVRTESRANWKRLIKVSRWRSAERRARLRRPRGRHQAQADQVDRSPPVSRLGEQPSQTTHSSRVIGVSLRHRLGGCQGFLQQSPGRRAFSLEME